MSPSRQSDGSSNPHDQDHLDAVLEEQTPAVEWSDRSTATFEAHARMVRAQSNAADLEARRAHSAIALADAVSASGKNNWGDSYEVETLISLYEADVQAHTEASALAAAAHREYEEATAETERNGRRYTRGVLELASSRLPREDWDAHRQLARIAVDNGYEAVVVQRYTNDASDRENLLTHTTEIGDRSRFAAAPSISDTEEAMGSTKSIEVFRDDIPNGYYGPTTPLEDSPVASTDWPDGPPSPTGPSHAHLDALNARHSYSDSAGPAPF